jgi:hypothetical protein
MDDGKREGDDVRRISISSTRSERNTRSSSSEKKRDTNTSLYYFSKREDNNKSWCLILLPQTKKMRVCVSLKTQDDDEDKSHDSLVFILHNPLPPRDEMLRRGSSGEALFSLVFLHDSLSLITLISRLCRLTNHSIRTERNTTRNQTRTDTPLIPI